MSYRPIFLKLLMLIGACAALIAEGVTQKAPDGPILIQPSDHQNIFQGENVRALLADYETYRLKFNPVEAARAKGRLPRSWPNLTPPARAMELAETEALLQRVTRLGPAHTLNTTILETILSSKVSRLRLDPDRLPFTGDSGFHTDLPRLTVRCSTHSKGYQQTCRPVPNFAFEVKLA